MVKKKDVEYMDLSLNGIRLTLAKDDWENQPSKNKKTILEFDKYNKRTNKAK